MEKLTLTTAGLREIEIPDATRQTHLQFLRFAGCPFCNIRLHAYERRAGEIVRAGIREVLVFRSTTEQLQRHHNDIPFDAVLDPEGKLYRQFGVESGLRSVLNPRVLMSALPYLAMKFPTGPGLPPAGARHDGVLGFPADFLIDPGGEIIACRYGQHADDHWSVDELLTLSRPHP